MSLKGRALSNFAILQFYNFQSIFNEINLKSALSRV
jgi:hypothetical protein